MRYIEAIFTVAITYAVIAYFRENDLVNISDDFCLLSLAIVTAGVLAGGD